MTLRVKKMKAENATKFRKWKFSRDKGLRNKWIINKR